MEIFLRKVVGRIYQLDEVKLHVNTDITFCFGNN